VTGLVTHSAAQPLPRSSLVVHASGALQLLGHAPALPAAMATSHFSAPLTRPSPQLALQSSIAVPGAQHSTSGTASELIPGVTCDASNATPKLIASQSRDRSTAPSLSRSAF
jgi:hypothetical protein